MRIRELERGDSDRIRELILELYDENPAYSTFGHRPDEGELEGVISGKLRGIAAGSIIDLVAVDDGRIVAECELVGTEPGRGVIGIMVEARSRRKGLGGELVSRAMRLAAGRGLAKAYANVRRENWRALKFFRACGFTEEAGAEGEIVVMSKGASAA